MLFRSKIEEINAIYGQQQIENINTTLNFIREFINIKHNNYNLSDSENDDVIEDKESNTLLENNLLESSNIIIPIPIPISIPIENSRDTELVNDLFKLDSNNTSYSSPILNPQTKFSYLKNEISFVLNPKKSNYDLSYDSDNDNKSSSNNDEEEILCSDLKNAKLANVSNYEKFNNKINVLKNINIQKSVNWCNKYNFPINKHFLNN